MILFVYTNMVDDVSEKDETTLDVDSFANPQFSFDIMELYMLADYFGIQDLMEHMQTHFFHVECLFSHVSFSNLQESEEKVARIMIKCENMRSPALLQSLATTYAEGTGGLACLCRWPTKYSRCVCVCMCVCVCVCTIPMVCSIFFHT